MSFILLRAIKRNTSWEKSPDDFYEMELTNGAEPDLDISVYEVADEAPTILRTISEHWASTKNPTPHSPCRALDATAAHSGRIEDTPGSGFFEFTRVAHREVRFMAECEVREFASVLIAERMKRTRAAGRDEVRRYMAERFVANDDEWRQVAASKPQWQEWAAKQPKPVAKTPKSPMSRELRPSDFPQDHSNDPTEPDGV